MLLVEIATWIASAEYLANPLILEPALSSFSKADGCLGVHWGLSEEDEVAIYLVTIWEGSEYSKASVNDPESFGNIGFSPSMKHDALQTYTVYFNDKVVPALTAPTTEVTFFTLKEGKTKNDLNRILDTVIATPDIVNSKYGPLTWGDIEGAPDNSYLLFGWESVKVHTTTVAQPSFSQFVIDLLDAAEIKFCHVNFTTYFSKPTSGYI